MVKGRGADSVARSRTKKPGRGPAPAVVWGLDPGQDQSGVAAIKDGRLLYAASFCPWSGRGMREVFHELLTRGGPPSVLWIEVPQNGTHASRGGVQLAAGMFCGAFKIFYPGFKRKSKKTVTPNGWRQLIYGTTKGTQWKERARTEFRARFGRKADTHDEAEAGLIALYGWERSLP